MSAKIHIPEHLNTYKLKRHASSIERKRERQRKTLGQTDGKRGKTRHNKRLNNIETAEVET